MIKSFCQLIAEKQILQDYQSLFIDFCHCNQEPISYFFISSFIYLVVLIM
jgi:hypothetical protein